MGRSLGCQPYIAEGGKENEWENRRGSVPWHQRGEQSKITQSATHNSICICTSGTNICEYDGSYLVQKSHGSQHIISCIPWHQRGGKKSKITIDYAQLHSYLHRRYQPLRVWRLLIRIKKCHGSQHITSSIPASVEKIHGDKKPLQAHYCREWIHILFSTVTGGTKQNLVSSRGDL